MQLFFTALSAALRLCTVVGSAFTAMATPSHRKVRFTARRSGLPGWFLLPPLAALLSHALAGRGLDITSQLCLYAMAALPVSLLEQRRWRRQRDRLLAAEFQLDPSKASDRQRARHLWLAYSAPEPIATDGDDAS